MAEADDDYLGAVLIVGIFHSGKEGDRAERYAGTIDRFVGEGEERGVVLICHDGVERAFPWDAEAVEELEPGSYKLHEGGPVVRDPDYIMQFSVEDDGE